MQTLIRARRLAALALVLLSCAGGNVSGVGAQGRTSAPPAAVIAAPPGGAFYGLTPQFAVSPDGRQVVFVADSPSLPPELWIQPMDAGPARRLDGTAQASYPFWSADSRAVGFFASGKLETVSAAGGPPVVVCDAPTGRGGTWNRDDVIVFTSGITDPLRKVAAAGGTPTPVTAIDRTQETSHRWPQFLPDGRHILFWAGGGSAPAQLKVASLDSADVVPVTRADSNGAYAAGFVFFGRGNALMALRFDPSTLQPTDEAVRIAAPLSGDAGSSFASLSVAAAGPVLYTHGAARGFGTDLAGLVPGGGSAPSGAPACTRTPP